MPTQILGTQNQRNNKSHIFFESISPVLYFKSIKEMVILKNEVFYFSTNRKQCSH